MGDSVLDFSLAALVPLLLLQPSSLAGVTGAARERRFLARLTFGGDAAALVEDYGAADEIVVEYSLGDGSGDSAGSSGLVALGCRLSLLQH